MPGHLSMAVHGARHRDPARSQSGEEAAQKTQALAGLCSREGTKRGDLEQSVQGTTLELVLQAQSPLHTCPCSLPREPACCLLRELPVADPLWNPSRAGTGGGSPEGQAANHHHPGSFSKTVFPRTGNWCLQKALR